MSRIEAIAALAVARGAKTSATTVVTVTSAGGGIAIPATALANRYWIQVFVPDGIAPTLYLSTGTPTATDHFVALTAGDSWAGDLGAGITLKGLSSGVDISVKVLELGSEAS